ncbi:MAG: hypothetical protein ACM31O_08170 [Bacteroidota bacterium]|jgi:hypothetical protein
MFKGFALSAAAVALMAGSALAQQAQPPTTADECLKAAFDLAQAAEEKHLGDDKLDRVEELLTKMESHCDANQFAEAMQVAGDIKSVLDGE